MDIREEIKRKQERLGLKDDWCGKRAGMPKPYAHHWRMAFRRNVSEARLNAMANAIGYEIRTKLVRKK